MNNEAALQVLFSATFFKREGIVFFFFSILLTASFFSGVHILQLQLMFSFFMACCKWHPHRLEWDLGSKGLSSKKDLCGDSEFESGQD